jgi:polysaccharide export outer membrane protein
LSFQESGGDTADTKLPDDDEGGALTGGSGFEVKQNDLRIICSVGTGRQVIRVDLKKIVNGQAPDPVLQAEDIIFLPTSSMKAAIKSGGIGTLLGIVSILLVATGI